MKCQGKDERENAGQNGNRRRKALSGKNKIRKNGRRETGETEDTEETEAVRAKTSLKMSEEHGVPEIDSRLDTDSRLDSGNEQKGRSKSLHERFKQLSESKRSHWRRADSSSAAGRAPPAAPTTPPPIPLAPSARAASSSASA